ncbi:import inner membrane translocase subunit tim-50 [Xylona heveae TC161]|uniref:Mitochondrial import inner membrane translocase subunit TIM50 n=1 Tax=Xylona heveae (strain CBS 132557 / TC161) TaxID=1328760 RepID=A0A165I7V4_XYLHT|nr:import inner membrane translocase subunit tim-50 [Xylona heveae TC161]KZF24511.1 import inner membrane translocase subunit tim-50 [Xylona heveae TC161]
MLSRAAARALAARSVRTPAAFQVANANHWTRTFASDSKLPPSSKRWANYNAPKGAKQPTSSSEPVKEPSQQKTPMQGAPATPSSSAAEKAEQPSTTAQETPSIKDLPDLTQGIPSTLDHETAGSTSEQFGSSTLNLTEDPAQTTSGRGGKGDGELPKSAYVSSVERRRMRVANYMYASFFLFCVTGSIYLGRNWETEEEEKQHPETPSGWGPALFYGRAKARVADMLDYYNEPAFPKLLPNTDPAWERPYTLVLSLEDLLVHSEWSREHGWRMAKRPGVDYFLRYLSQYYELVIFTTVPSMIADPVIRKLDPFRIVMWPLFREATRYKNGEYIKDLSYLNRDLSKVILVDTVAAHARLQPDNAIVLPKWQGNSNDKELVALIPFLEYVATMGFDDTRTVLKSFEGSHIPTEFAKREAVAREKFMKQLEEERAHRPKKSGVGLLGSLLGIKPPGGGLDGMEPTPSEGFEQGKMLQDQVRERGQKQYEFLEREIRLNGEKWLKEMAAEEEKAKDEQIKGMKQGFVGMFGGGAK